MKSILVGLAISAVLGSGCAARTSAPISASPSHVASEAWLAGTWRGALYETPASYWYGHREFAVKFADDGSWTIPGTARPTSGTSDGRSRLVVVDGPLVGEGSPLHYTLKRYGPDELFGVIETSFAGRDATAILVLRRAP